MYQLLISFIFFFIIFTSCFQSSGNPQLEQLTTLAAVSGISSSGGQIEIPEEAPKIEILSVSPENYKPGDLVTVNYKISQVGTGMWTGPVSFYLADSNNCMGSCLSIRDTLNNPWTTQDIGNFTSYFNSTSWPYGNYNFSLLVNNQIVAKSKPLESMITHVTASTLTMNGSALSVTINSAADEKLYKLNVGPTYKDFIVGIDLVEFESISNASLYPPGSNGSDIMKNTSISPGGSLTSKNSIHYPQATGNYEILLVDKSGSFPVSFTIQAKNTSVSGGGSCNNVGSIFDSEGCTDHVVGTLMTSDICDNGAGAWSSTQTCAQRNPGLTVSGKCTSFEFISFWNYEFVTRTTYSNTSSPVSTATANSNCSDGLFQAN
ncbi:hypothetical protein [Leptospira saintgironsiae]|uniref:Uncharacterized protein n=1 Tax=Leptospira saintgironsiae TaxID=2023183 RepID=A0A2M9Y7N8_9LEPT|nr:hypothetical protein [Leptospira saintgironsiae]PJZ47600.1 hypothetical protein CH362_18360 [Leptospira saintgironsiae]